MKKIFLIIYMITALGITKANQVIVNSGSGAPGSRDNIISIVLNNSAPVRGIQLQIADTLNYLVADSAWTAERTSAFEIFHYNPVDQNGYLSIMLFSQSTIPVASGEIVKIRYSVSAQAPPQTVVPLLCKKVVLTDENNVKLKVVYQNGVFEVTSTSKVESADNQPVEYNLAQNYPNPFNPSTNISFGLAKPDYTTLTIYNMLGQQIRSLVKSNLKSGRYEYRWDGMDNYGLQVSAGVYLYQLVSGDFKETRQLTLVR